MPCPKRRRPSFHTASAESSPEPESPVALAGARGSGDHGWIFSPRASIATSVSMRLARLSGFFAVCTRHNTA
jgi:hypothetical protein